MTTLPDDPIGSYRPGLFAGQVAVVTGGGRGIGRAIALGFARLGGGVAIASRHEENLQRTAAQIIDAGGDCYAVVCDIRVPESVEDMVSKVVARFGAVDALVNNAGGQFPARPSAISDRGWRAVVDLNLNGTWYVCNRVVPHLIERGHGSIVNIVHSQVRARGAPLFVHSGAARAGVVNLTYSLARYLAQSGITVNALGVGAVMSEGYLEEELPSLPPGFHDQLLRDIPAGRAETPEEVAAQVLFLCSPAARYVTGLLLQADGGAGMGPELSAMPPEAQW